MTKSSRRTVVVLLVLALFAGLEITQWHDDRAADARQRRDIAAVEAGAGTLTYEALSRAWRDERVSRPSAFRELTKSVPIEWASTYEDEGAIILVFHSAGR